RLDRLLVLLDTGGSSAVRETAARQIAQFAAKNVTKDAAADIPLQDAAGPSTSSHAAVWQGTTSEWNDVMTVVGKILPYLHSKSFETRSAATSALSHICQMTPAWSPQNPPVDSSTDPPIPAPEFPPFNVTQVLKEGTLLLASSGKEFSEPVVFGTPAEVARARKEAMNRLGLGFMDAMGDDTDDTMLDIDNELSQNPSNTAKAESPELMELDSPAPNSNDLKPHHASSPSKLGSSPEHSPMLPPSNHDQSVDSPSADTPGLSARERNRLKRKLKTGNHAVVTGPSAASKPSGSGHPPNNEDGPKARPVASQAEPSTSKAATLGPEKVVVDPTKGGQVEAKEQTARYNQALNVPEGTWVWAGAVSVLLVDLCRYSPNWEMRHGAAMALREIIKIRGVAGGMKDGATSDENQIAHERWCNDLAAKFLCLFVLDRFSDFVSDQVVAPVRETVSQTLGALLTHMPRRSVLHVHAALLQMVRLTPSTANGSGPAKTTNGKGKGKAVDHDTKSNGEIAWQVRHAGLVGVKYEVAVRPDLVDDPDSGEEVLRGVLDAAISGLCDHDDDVRSVAATCLTPIASQLVERMPQEIARLLGVLWDCLNEMKDDLSSSVGFVMELLGKLLSFDASIAVLSNTNSSRPLAALVPILFPFFRHTIANVRLAVVNTLHNFLSVPNLSDDWLSDSVLRLLFQNLLLEERLDIQTLTLQTWRSVVSRLKLSASRLLEMMTPYLRDWFALLMNPLGVAMDSQLLFHHIPAGAEDTYNVDKNMIAQDLSLVSTETILRGRVACSQALATVIASWPMEQQGEVFKPSLDFYSHSSSMLQQFLSATIVSEWAAEHAKSSTVSPPPSLTSDSSLAREMVAFYFEYLAADPPVSYYEMFLNLTSICNACRNALEAFQRDGKVSATKIPELPHTVDTDPSSPTAFTITMAHSLVDGVFPDLLKSLPKRKKSQLQALEEKVKGVQQSLDQYKLMKDQHDARVASAVAGALIALRELPAKLNPVIRSVMNGVKFEENPDLQLRAAKSVAAFAVYSISKKDPQQQKVTDKIVKNFTVFICQDDEYTPVFESLKNVLEGILVARQRQASENSKSGKGSKAAKEVEPAPSAHPSRLVRRGAQAALAEIAAEFGETLFSELPVIWELTAKPIIDIYRHDDPSPEAERLNGQAIVDCLTILKAVIPTFHRSLHPRIMTLFPTILKALMSGYAIIRQCAAQCLATICDVMTVEAMLRVVEDVIPLLGDAKNLTHKQGAIEAIHDIVMLLDVKVLPYIIFLIVPVLGRMSDPDDDLRYLATNTFASLVKMVPLEAGLPDPTGFSAELLERREQERAFLTQLLDGSKVENYKLPVPIQAELRKYQQDGVNWLAFLAKYQLHGILCDDMGLGKTLQSICILAGKTFERAEKYRLTKSPDAQPLPSLIVCPPTLVGHWYHEIKKYAHTLKPLMYVGASRDRQKQGSKLGLYDVVVTSYEVVRNDQSTLGKYNWLYCILDEGHIIKNPKAKLTKAVKTIKSHHRLILSGTPIQNNVLELWSLFDFLMPGFLGTESFFNERFGKPIAASREAKSSAKVKEVAANALEALHKQVLPFLLRRLKEDVLNDLPPKIIQDYQCDLSDLQKQLYDAYAQSQAMVSAQSAVQTGEGGSGQGHVFQSLQYLRKVCNHPALVLKSEQDIAKFHHGPGQFNIRDIAHAPKLEALRQLLNDCGVGAPPETKEEAMALEPESVISQHRVLIFCQMKQMLDIIETDLFKALMPTVTYMRLDGTTDATKRHAVVETFNSDPSIDCLLLTTHVGGLGLTLTGADTVIFVEHDWNPMKDLQAMDRAHRLGQKKVVNVYRLITKGTLEEKIMGLQRFKLNIANSVITQQNSGLDSMDTDLVLDLFKRTTEEEDAASAKKKKAAVEDKPATAKNVLEGLDDLPPEDEYNFDLSSFLGTLGRP
ncbi:hypothetical protein DL93DRAFT_2209827, partial [Clavulina sp. PMI_390]